MTTATINASISDEQHEEIGKFIRDSHMTHCAGGIVLARTGVDKSHMLTIDDQQLILLHSHVLGDNRIAQEMFGADDPQQEINASTFVRELLYTMRRFGKQARRQEILQQTNGARVVSFKNSRGGRLVVHPAVRTDAKTDWQLTTIGQDGIPWGHNNPPSFEEAIFRAIGVSEDGYWNESGYSYEWSDNSGKKPPI
jgi:hypothetical protein